MKTKITKIIFSIIAVFGLIFLPTTTAFADDYKNEQLCNSESTPESVKIAYGCPDKVEKTEAETAIISILNTVISIVGIIAVIFIIIGGVNYMTSSGDSNKVKKAKDTILYAVIGLIVCALAFAIVNFVVAGVLNNT